MKFFQLRYLQAVLKTTTLNQLLKTFDRKYMQAIDLVTDVEDSVNIKQDCTAM